MTRLRCLFPAAALGALVACLAEGETARHRPPPQLPQAAVSPCTFFAAREVQQLPCSCGVVPSLGWCGSLPSPLEPRDAHAELVRAAVGDMLAYRCGDCHTSVAAPTLAAEPRAIDDLDALVANHHLLPLQSGTSPLWQLAASGAMPPPGSRVAPLTQGEIDLLALFIDSPRFWPGAVAPEDCAPPLASTDFDELFAQVTSDLATLPSSELPFYRYLSLAHRAASVCKEADLEGDRQALLEGLNLLSLGPSVKAPVAVDAARLLYRIDLRDFDWLRSLELRGVRFADVWEAIATQSPYSVEFTGRDAELAQTATGTAFPLLFADHVLDQALGGELYPAILGFAAADTLSELLQTDFGIDQYADLTDGRLRRAGTSSSRLAPDELVVDRYDLATGGALWTAVDFHPSASSIFESPLDYLPGPTQLMFTLPNGLFGFLSADPNDALVSNTEFRFELRAVAVSSHGAIMCPACHASGLIPVVDEVKDVALRNAHDIGLDPEELEQLEQIYPEPTVFAGLVERDSQGYRQALSELGLPSTGADPVARASLRFDQPLTLRDAAAELGLRPEALAEQLSRVDAALAPLAQGGTLGRDAFARVYLGSLCVLAESLTNRPAAAACERAGSPLGRR